LFASLLHRYFIVWQRAIGSLNDKAFTIIILIPYSVKITGAKTKKNKNKSWNG